MRKPRFALFCALLVLFFGLLYGGLGTLSASAATAVKKATADPSMTAGSISSGADSYTRTRTQGDGQEFQTRESGSNQLAEDWNNWEALNPSTEAPDTAVTKIVLDVWGRTNPGSTNTAWVRFWNYGTSAWSATWYQLGTGTWTTTSTHYNTADITNTTEIQNYLDASGNFKIEFADQDYKNGVSGGTRLDWFKDYFAVTFTYYTLTTTVGDGTNPANATIAPGTTNQPLDAFTLQTSSGTDSITAVQVTTANTAAVNTVYIKSNDGLTTYGSSSSPSGNNWNITLATNITANTTLTSYRVYIDAKGYAALAAGDYAVTGTVTQLTSSNSQAYNDSASATLTVDRSPPANATWGTITPGNSQITLNWTNPADADFSAVLILRNTASITDAPTDGNTYSAPGTIGTSTVVYVGSGTTYTDTGLTNGTSYYYKIFAYDTYLNYASGVQTGPYSPVTPPTMYLSYPASPYDNGVDPDNNIDATTGRPKTGVTFTYRIVYTSSTNTAPAGGYPKLYLGFGDNFVAYTMTAVTPGDTTYSDGKEYQYQTLLGPAPYQRYYFQASDGTNTVVEPAGAPTTYRPGPTVPLMLGYNLVSLAKDLTAVSYNAADAFGTSYAYRWVSTGLDNPNPQGSYAAPTTASPTETGEGYMMYAGFTTALMPLNSVGAVTAASFTIQLQQGWNIIGNPYTGNVLLQNVWVKRGADTPLSFGTAVNLPYEYIGNGLYEYIGNSSYNFKTYNLSPLAVLTPWVGYWIYLKKNDTTYSLIIDNPCPGGVCP